MSKADGKTYNPGPVPKEALSYFRAKGYKVGFDYRDVWKEEHASAFTVAKATQMDVLKDIRGAVDKALADGQTFAQFKKELAPTLRKKGWWGIKEMVDPVTGKTVTAQLGSPRRLKTIYRANMRTARAAGQWDRAQRTKKYRPYFVYTLGPSRVHRKLHLSWNHIILPVDHPWWRTHFPPNGWECKCRLRQVSEQEAKRLGGVTQAPEIKYQKWKNKRTGETQQVPVGIDPGWDYNPGAAGRLSQSAKQTMDKVARVPANIGAGAAGGLPEPARVAQADEVRTWINDIRNGRLTKAGGRRTVATMNRNTVDKLKALGVEPETAAITLEQRSVTHLLAEARKGDKALPAEMIPEIVELLRDPVAVVWDGQGRRPALLYVVEVPQPGKYGRIAVRINLAKGKDVTNAVRSAGVITRDNLRDPNMVLLEGKIK